MTYPFLNAQSSFFGDIGKKKDEGNNYYFFKKIVIENSWT